MKTLIRALSRRFGALPKPYRALVVGVLMVFALYNAANFGEAVGRAAYHLTH